MIYVKVVWRTIFGNWVTETKEFGNKIAALRFMYSARSKGHIIDSWTCDDYMDNEWLGRRFRL